MFTWLEGSYLYHHDFVHVSFERWCRFHLDADFSPWHVSLLHLHFRGQVHRIIRHHFIHARLWPLFKAWCLSRQVQHWLNLWNIVRLTWTQHRTVVSANIFSANLWLSYSLSFRNFIDENAPCPHKSPVCSYLYMAYLFFYLQGCICAFPSEIRLNE